MLGTKNHARGVRTWQKRTFYEIITTQREFGRRKLLSVRPHFYSEFSEDIAIIWWCCGFIK